MFRIFPLSRRAPVTSAATPSRRRGRSCGRKRELSLECERLEPRAMLAVTASLSGAQLLIGVTGGDTATLSYDGTSYTVSGGAGMFAASSVTSIVANQGDANPNTFSLANDLTAPNLEYLQANFANGSVVIGKAITCTGSSSFPVQFLGTSITLAGTISAGASFINFSGPVSLEADVTLATKGKVVNFTKSLDGAHVLSVDTNQASSTGGQVNFIDNVGSATPLAGLAILSGGATQNPGKTIKLDGSAAGAATDGITVAAGCQNVLFSEGGTVANFKGSGIVVQGGTGTGVSTAQFSSFSLAGNGKDGIDVQGGKHATVTISGNTISGTASARNGITLENQAESSTITVSNNTITAQRTGIYISGSLSPATVEKNTITFAATANPSISYGILYAPTAAGTVTIGSTKQGNTVTGGGTGIYLTGTLDKATVAANTLTNCASGITLVAASSSKTSLLVTSNTIDGTKQPGSAISSTFGVYMADAQKITLGGNGQGNTISNVGQGLYATGVCTGTGVTGNSIGAGGYGTGVGLTLAAATGLTVGAAGTDLGNTIHASRQAIYATGDLDGTTLSGNTIEDALVGVVLSSAANLAVGGTSGLGNTFRATAASRPLFIGTYAAGDCGGTTIEANAFTNLPDASFKLGQGFGMYLDGAQGLAIGGATTGAVVNGNQLTGFYAGLTASGDLAGTTVEGNIVGGAGTVIGLELNAAQNLAVGKANTQNATFGNTFYEALAFGTFATGACTGTVLDSNFLTANGYGLYGTNAGAVKLQDNYLYSNDAAGITLDGAGSAGNVILSNAIYANGSSGISLVNGANPGVAAPVLTAATKNSATGTIAGTAGQIYRIQYFTTPSILTPSAAAAEGRTLLTLQGGLTYEDVTLAGPTANLNPTFNIASPNAAIAEGDYLTATATLLSTGVPAVTSAFSPGVQYGTAAAPLAVTFDSAQAGLTPAQIYVSIQPGEGPGGLTGFLVTYNSSSGQDRLVPFGRPDYVISQPLSLAEITDPATSRPTLYVTQGVSLSTFVSYGAPMVPSTTAPSVIDTADPDYRTRYQQFELTRNYPAVDGDQGNLTHINYFTAPMKLENFATSDATLASPLQTKSFGTNTAASIFASLAAIPAAGGGTIGGSNAVVSDAGGAVRVIGPSTFTSGLPYPSMRPYVQSLAGTTTKIWNYNGFNGSGGTPAYQVNFGPSAFNSKSQSFNDADNYLTMTVDANGKITVSGTINITQTAGGSASQTFTDDAAAPWMVIDPGSTPADVAAYNLAIYGQAKDATTTAVTYPSPKWADIGAYLVGKVNATPDPTATTQALLVGDVTSALLLGFANAAPTQAAFNPFSGTIYPAGYPNQPTITYNGQPGNPQPIAVKDMRSHEWWNFDPATSPTAQVLQPSSPSHYNQYAAIIQQASGNQTYTIPYSDRLGIGPLIQTVQYNGTKIGTVKVTLFPPISLPQA